MRDMLQPSKGHDAPRRQGIYAKDGLWETSFGATSASGKNDFSFMGLGSQKILGMAEGSECRWENLSFQGNFGFKFKQSHNSYIFYGC